MVLGSGSEGQTAAEFLELVAAHGNDFPLAKNYRGHLALRDRAVLGRHAREIKQHLVDLAIIRVQHLTLIGVPPFARLIRRHGLLYLFFCHALIDIEQFAVVPVGKGLPGGNRFCHRCIGN